MTEQEWVAHLHVVSLLVWLIALLAEQRSMSPHLFLPRAEHGLLQRQGTLATGQQGDSAALRGVLYPGSFLTQQCASNRQLCRAPYSISSQLS